MGNTFQFQDQLNIFLRINISEKVDFKDEIVNSGKNVGNANFGAGGGVTHLTQPCQVISLEMPSNNFQISFC